MTQIIVPVYWTIDEETNAPILDEVSMRIEFDNQLNRIFRNKEELVTEAVRDWINA